jgi:hypothetical protein
MNNCGLACEKQIDYKCTGKYDMERFTCLCMITFHNMMEKIEPATLGFNSKHDNHYTTENNII